MPISENLIIGASIGAVGILISTLVIMMVIVWIVYRRKAKKAKQWDIADL